MGMYVPFVAAQSFSILFDILTSGLTIFQASICDLHLMKSKKNEILTSAQIISADGGSQIQSGPTGRGLHFALLPV